MCILVIVIEVVVFIVFVGRGHCDWGFSGCGFGLMIVLGTLCWLCLWWLWFVRGGFDVIVMHGFP